jgi:hypothetical protein
MTVEAAAKRGQMDSRLWKRIEAAEAEIALDTLSCLSIALRVDPADLLSESPKQPTRH